MKNAMILAAVISAIFAGSACAKTPVKNSVETEQENYVPSYEKCSYENDELWVQNKNYCMEGVINCPDIILVVINKKTGEFNYMRGEYHNRGNFYQFKDKKYEYLLNPDENEMYIEKKNGESETIKLNSCNGK